MQIINLLKRSSLYTRALVCALLLALIVPSGATRAAGTGTAVAAIQPAVVFIYLPFAEQTGSGVVVHTEASGSDIVTAAHVVKPRGEIQVYFQGDLDHPHSATVVRTASNDDLALLHTNDSAASQASVASDVSSGEPIGILGYPTATSVQLAAKGELHPEALLGAVTSVRAGGAVISTNAPTEHGDSGAPIFEQGDAEIVGIVTGHFGTSKYLGFQGTGVASLRKFLIESHVGFYGANGLQGGAGRDTTGYRPVIGLQTLREARGAHRLLVDVVLDVRGNLPTTSTSSASQASVVALATTLHRTIATSLEPAFGAALIDDGSVQNVVSSADLGKAAYERGYIGAVQEVLSLNTSTKAMGLLNQFVASTKINVIDRYGDTIFTAGSTKTQQQPINFMDEQIEGVWKKVTQQVIAAITDQATASANYSGTNFGRFGIPISTGGKSPLFAVVPDGQGARVTSLFPYGTAARSTLQLNDLIVALDGQDLAKIPAEQRTALFTQHAGTVYRCTVMEADGQPVVMSFDAEDIRWYIEHPLDAKPRN